MAAKKSGSKNYGAKGFGKGPMGKKSVAATKGAPKAGGK